MQLVAKLDWPAWRPRLRRFIDIDGGVAMVVQRAYVERFSPGTYIRVDSPHFMEAAIPGRIVDELRKIIAAIRTGAS